MSADWIDAADDSRALELVHERVDGGRFELWERERLIASFPKRPA